MSATELQESSVRWRAIFRCISSHDDNTGGMPIGTAVRAESQHVELYDYGGEKNEALARAGGVVIRRLADEDHYEIACASETGCCILELEASALVRLTDAEFGADARARVARFIEKVTLRRSFEMVRHIGDVLHCADYPPGTFVVVGDKIGLASFVFDASGSILVFLATPFAHLIKARPDELRRAEAHDWAALDAAVRQFLIVAYGVVVWQFTSEFTQHNAAGPQAPAPIAPFSAPIQ